MYVSYNVIFGLCSWKSQFLLSCPLFKLFVELCGFCFLSTRLRRWSFIAAKLDPSHALNHLLTSAREHQYNCQGRAGLQEYLPARSKYPFRQKSAFSCTRTFRFVLNSCFSRLQSSAHSFPVCSSFLHQPVTSIVSSRLFHVGLKSYVELLVT